MRRLALLGIAGFALRCASLPAIADPLLRVAGFCREHGDPALVDQALAQYRDGDHAGAALALAAILHDLRSQGVSVPEDRYADVVEALAAIEGLQRGLRALDGRDAHGKLLSNDGGSP